MTDLRPKIGISWTGPLRSIWLFFLYQLRAGLHHIQSVILTSHEVLLPWASLLLLVISILLLQTLRNSTSRPANLKRRQGAVPQEAVILGMFIIDLQFTAVRKGLNDIFESFRSKTVGRNHKIAAGFLLIPCPILCFRLPKRPLVN